MEKYSKRHPLFWFSFLYIVFAKLYLDDLKKRIEDKYSSEARPLTIALVRSFSLLHGLSFFLSLDFCAYASFLVFGWIGSVTYICSVEFGQLYCGGETIGSHYLTKFARFLTDHERYGLASRVMNFVVMWNEFWLGKDARSAGASLKKAAVFNALAGKPWWRLAMKYSNSRFAKSN